MSDRPVHAGSYPRDRAYSLALCSARIVPPAQKAATLIEWSSQPHELFYRASVSSLGSQKSSTDLEETGIAQIEAFRDCGSDPGSDDFDLLIAGVRNIEAAMLSPALIKEA